MKRAALFLSCALLSAASLHGQDDPLAWLNAVRARAGAPPVAPDLVLSRTAAAWAGVLARAGVLSHRGSDGTSARERYRALGGTEVHVGEILGAGPRLIDIEDGWMRSAKHRDLARARSWTHVGWGSAPSRGEEVWVVMFCEKLVEGLRVEQDERGVLVSGRFTALEATGAVLLAGVDRWPVSSWDPAVRFFAFEVPAARASFMRLGYETAAGGLHLTNFLTSSRGTGSPAAPSRSAAPAAPP